ncbi:MAG: DUF1592 domain-containing protein [Myxococcales bacterium]|nr:MAG: DUF1592 domain-containing protein [Myxococcales bacterium]
MLVLRVRSLGCVLLLSACSQGEIGAYSDNWQAPTEEQVLLPESARPETLRLLTRTEFQNTVTDLGIIDDAAAIVGTFPDQNVSDGFDNMAHSHVANPLLIEAYMRAAEMLSGAALAKRVSLTASIMECAGAAGTTKACGLKFLDHFIPKMFRFLVPEEQLSSYKELFEVVFNTSGFNAAFRMSLEAALQSPDFLYRAELPNSAGTLDPFVMASRLSYFLWSTMPDDELFEAARSGALSTRIGVESQARRMLEAQRAKMVVWRFSDQWLKLYRAYAVTKDRVRYPEFSPALRGAWRTSVLAFINDQYFGDGTLEDRLLSPKVFVNQTLADLYGWQMPAPSEGYLPIEADSDRFSGLLSQPGLMAILAKSDQSSPIHRGVFIREKLLCEHLPPPPPDAPASVPPVDDNQTTRERVTKLTSAPNAWAVT